MLSGRRLERLSGEARSGVFDKWQWGSVIVKRIPGLIRQAGLNFKAVYVYGTNPMPPSPIPATLVP